MMRLFVACGLLFLSGCGEGTGTVPVQGVVTLDGQPLARATVQFAPLSSGRDATATTDENGKFSLSTYDPMDGAMPGSYKVIITPATPLEATPAGASADQAMMAAAAAAKSRVKAQGPQVPEAYTRADQTPLKQQVPATGQVVIDIKSK